MEPEGKEESTESSSSESQETTSRTKLRDLRPEKDPMGGGSKAALKPNDAGAFKRLASEN